MAGRFFYRHWFPIRLLRIEIGVRGRDSGNLNATAVPGGEDLELRLHFGGGDE